MLKIRCNIRRLQEKNKLQQSVVHILTKLEIQRSQNFKKINGSLHQKMYNKDINSYKHPKYKKTMPQKKFMK